MREVVTLRLGGVDQVLSPTWGAYADIEARTGKSIRQLWIALLTSSLELRHMAVIVCAGMRASDGGRNISEERTMQLIFESGVWWDLEDGIGPAIIAYLEALGWTPEQRGKIAAERERMEQETPSAGYSPSAQPATD